MNNTSTRRTSRTARRQSSMENSISSSTHSRLSEDELHAVSNDTARRLLENMDDSQIEKAMESFQNIKLKRLSIRSSGRSLVSAAADNNEEGASLRKSISGSIKSSEDPNSVVLSNADAAADIPLPPFDGKKKGSITEDTQDGRRMSKSQGAFGALATHDFSQYVSDSDSDEDVNTASKYAEHFKTIDRGLTKLHEEDVGEETCDAEDNGQEMSKDQFDPEPVRRKRVGRRTAFSNSVGPGTVSHSQWKPLSEPTVEKIEESEETDKADEDEANQGGIGGLWNKFTKKLSGGSGPAEAPPQEPKKVDGSKYFRRGKRRAEKCQFLEAVALFNFALMRQREELGENHVDCGRTLNEIGLCWLMLGERYPAMTAFEEALYILQKRLGDGAQEVAEVTNNIWMVLHEQREEAMLGNSNHS